MSKKWNGIIFNHSQMPHYVIETDTGPSLVHILGPKMKSPIGLDADGFKRVDGQSVLGHKDWWKIIPLVSVDIYQVGSDFLLPVSLIRPVPDQQFGNYKTIDNKNWGIPMAYITGVIRDRNNKVVNYITDKYGVVTREQGIELTNAGELDNVIAVNTTRSSYLRAKPNIIITDNIG